MGAARVDILIHIEANVTFAQIISNGVEQGIGIKETFRFGAQMA